MDLLERLQQDVTEFLPQVPGLEDVPVFAAWPRVNADGTEVKAPEIATMIANAVNGVKLFHNKAGLAIFVQMADERLVDHLEHGDDLQVEAMIRVNVEERTLINRGPKGIGLSAAEIADIVLKALHWRFLGISLRSDERQGKKPYQYDDGVRGYELTFRGVWNRSVTPSCSKLKISAAGAVVTLSTDTAGAAIYYTIDGSLPSPTNSNATLYTAPFILGESAQVRAMACKSGMLPSDLLQKTITV